MTKIVKHFIHDNKGATLVEYGLMVGLIAVVCLVAVQTLGTTLNGFWGTINTALAG